MIPVSDSQIGGAIVRRRIDRGTLPPLNAGDRLTREEVLAMATANRRALVSSERLWLAPRTDVAAGSDAVRHIVHNGGGRYDVIAGVKLNDRILTKDEAEELAIGQG